MLKNCFYPLLLLLIGFTLTSFGGNDKIETVQDPFIVVLDAGHGGHDPGNLGNGFLEKNIALKIVLRVGAILAKEKNVKVIYTRDDDTFVDLYKRGEIANKANANLFVSVHCDSHTSEAHGAGTFVLGLHANKQNFEIAKKENSSIYLEDNYESRYAAYNINSPESVIGLTIMQEEFLDQSIMLAKTMQDNFTGKLQRVDRKVKQAGFIVLHQTFMPSVLVETGFLTHKPEGEYLNSVKGQNDMGDAIASAILQYKKAISSNVSDQITEVKPVVPVVVKEETVVKEVPKVVKEPVVVAPKVVKPKEVPEIAKEAPKSEVVFKVQIMASSKDLGLSPANFKGLNTISKEAFKNIYRYMYGSTTSYDYANTLRKDAEDKGFKGAYVVAYKNDVRINIKEAIK
ncbi:N-acetylmuramoyl-L-alanine amidase [Cellulophaga sp. HaHa_2_95]|uniref:N-acetylmuramoyl-L-alanine amidase family protein n=1 Tax=Cellulophaga sp. HaHa_2_95 TaxID=2745558 RepID=UPI001C4E86F3|nr:N-acetylmuramoyl-L-alanine amidase [Cellulophaga sp. HaHa_2_95]QXP55266.1 N-acetylmuramoyl-L-alanine amidase [Cellulophaga sp. HaHa_2_95]